MRTEKIAKEVKPSQKDSFDPSIIEPKWQKKWLESQVYSPDMDKAKNPFYNLMMFPYPSAEGLHVGSFFTYGGIDAYGRFKRMQGYDVFEPIGLDGFGIHSENYAIKVGRTPHEHARISEENFYRQLHMLGNAFDWTRKLETYDPAYYKWTQWLFTELFKAGLAYKAKATVNFCPSCKTVLSDEQVIDGKCERCSSVVEKRELEQWFFRITEYAERLLQNTEKLDWTEKVKIAQKNWIGRSEGALIEFKVQSSKFKVEVFTTRPDTLFGATFLVLSPEHPLVPEIISKKIQVPDENRKEIVGYLEKVKLVNKEDIAKEKSGIFSGLYAINPVNNQQIPIWIADYVLMEYGTGAIMAVPAHDERDFEFAKKYELPVIQVVRKKEAPIKSYLMGADSISNEDLTQLGIKIVEVTSKGYRKIIIAEESLASYEKLIEDKLTPGFWNEYVGKQIVFLFKLKDKSFKRIILSPETEEQIERLGSELNEEEYTRNMVWKWLAENDWYHDLIIHSQYGILNNYSGEFEGLTSEEAKKNIVEKLQKEKVAEPKVHYHLRDWLISRQRYWGPPIPMIFCQNCADQNKSWFTSSEAKETGMGISNDKYQMTNVKSNSKIGNLKIEIWNSAQLRGWYPVPEEQLPVLLPIVKDYKPLGTGKAPLANYPDFYETSCPGCGAKAVRETDVSDTFLDSSWYFFRYISTEFKDKPFDKLRAKKWLPVSSYIGGAEHAVLHLLYSRFITMVLHDLGYIGFEEPYAKFRANGLIIKEGAKMSKSKGNVINPDEYVKKFGADTVRTYLGFIGPFTQGGDFQDSGIEGMYRFLKRVWVLLTTKSITSEQGAESTTAAVHKAVKQISDDMEHLRYNTAIAQLMTLYNVLSKEDVLNQEQVETFLKLLAPFAPHMTEELWSQLSVLGFQFSDKSESVNQFTSKVKTGKPESENRKPKTENWSIHTQPWPTYDEEWLVQDEVTLVVQVNGKVRDFLRVHGTGSKVQAEVEKQARESSKVKRYLMRKEIKKVIFVPGKIINFVVNE